MIENSRWVLNTLAYRTVSEDYDAVKTYYNNEIGNLQGSYQSKIGLMYISDYGYAASPNNWNTVMIDYSMASNWLKGLDEWTITRNFDNLVYDFYYAYYIYRSGSLDGHGDIGEQATYASYNARPVFYLKSNVAITSGTGTSSDPYRITLS